MASLLRMIERVTGMAGLVVAWIIFPLILATCYEVFSRYALNAPTIWAFELSYMAMGTHALIGAPIPCVNTAISASISFTAVSAQK